VVVAAGVVAAASWINEIPWGYAAPRPPATAAVGPPLKRMTGSVLLVSAVREARPRSRVGSSRRLSRTPRSVLARRVRATAPAVITPGELGPYARRAG